MEATSAISKTLTLGEYKKTLKLANTRKIGYKNPPHPGLGSKKNTHNICETGHFLVIFCIFCIVFDLSGHNMGWGILCFFVWISRLDRFLYSVPPHGDCNTNFRGVSRFQMTFLLKLHDYSTTSAFTAYRAPGRWTVAHVIESPNLVAVTHRGMLRTLENRRSSHAASPLITTSSGPKSHYFCGVGPQGCT